MLFHGILQNIIPIVMNSTSKIIKLDGADIVYQFDDVGYSVGLPVSRFFQTLVHISFFNYYASL